MSEDAKRRRFALRRESLRELIEQVSQGNNAEFARVIGREPSYASFLSNVLTGKKNLGEDAVADICGRLGVPTSRLDESSKPLTTREKSTALYSVETVGLTPDVVSLARRIASLDHYWRRAVDAIIAIGESVPSEAVSARRKRR
jgi:hypothetical protein